jgi:hypothetical protein
MVDDWIIREFTKRGLTPPHCTPEAFARALEYERHITIEFQPHVSEDPGVYGLLYRYEGPAQTYIILFRPTPSIILRRLTLFHELAHLLFNHPLTEVGGEGVLRGYMVADAEDAQAEAFAVGAMHYSLCDEDEPLQRTAMDDDVSASALADFLKRTEYWP